MKRTLITFLLCIAALIGKADTRLFHDTTYRRVDHLAKFAGTWEFEKNGEIFRIVLAVKKNYIKEGNLFMDQVEGYHQYLKNGQLIQDSKKEHPTLIHGGYFYDFVKAALDSNSIKFLLTDKQRKDREECHITLLPGNKLKWTIKNMEAVGRTPDREIHLPNNIILTKVQ